MNKDIKKEYYYNGQLRSEREYQNGKLIKHTVL